MDLVTKEVIEKALDEFDGTIIMVSHDRYLLNKVPNKIVEMLPGQMMLYNGNFDYYLERSAILAEQLAAAEIQEKKEIKESEGAAQYHRAKQQRSEDARRKRRLKELEDLIEILEGEEAELERQIADPETASDFELLNEKCRELEDVKGRLNQVTDEWIALSDE